MIYGLYHSAAGMLVNEYRQDVLANNLANADTVGFKREIPIFAERVPAETAGRRQGESAAHLQALSGGLWLGRTQTDFTPGPTTSTQNPSDFALDGPGFVAVASGERTLYTRDGRTLLDADGTLVSALDGAPLLNRQGRPIQLNPRGSKPTVDLRGRVIQDGNVVGELMVVDFDDYTGLRKAGATRFAAEGQEPRVAAAFLRSGVVEQAAISPTQEMVSMIAASRAYQINAQMITLQDQTIGRAISVLVAQ